MKLGEHLALLSLLVLTTSSSSQTVLTFTPGKDNTLIEPELNQSPRSNGAGPVFFVGRTSPTGQETLRRGVIAFDLSSIPAVASVQSVTLTLNMSMTNPGASTIALQRLLADWGEGTSFNTGGVGAPATAGDATWIHRFFNSELWNSAGGDFSATVSASVLVGGNGPYTWGPTPQMIADVQDWVSNPSQNFGWIIIGDEEQLQTAKRFDTKENDNPGARPLLTVTFLPTAVNNDDHVLPTQFNLAQNYPNPFNPSTVIHYRVPKTADGRLEIFDVLGKKVRTLVQGRLNIGSHRVLWNGTNDAGELLPSGIYLYRLQAGGLAESRKMAFVR
ncbi:MAG TPA: DNRLRE domain-containing protein [bacterium]